ncbi:alpha/beta fold hydrolase [Candidatus Viridilinea mediisalina]|nr:alpha/beta hydrolase [Candidatus Viridilinea mediisalina]
MPNDDAEQPSAIRRGRGLRLSTEGAADAQAEPSEAAPEQPARRGRGLRLSTEGAADAQAEAEAEAEAPPAFALQRESIKTAYGSMSYLTGGTGTMPLVMLHGWGASARIWTDVAAALAERRKLVLLDLPGSGGTPARVTIPTLTALANEVLDAIDALGLERFELLGHGLGAATAALVAGQLHRRVSRVALLGMGIRSFAPDLLAMGLARLPFDISVGMARPLLNFWQPFNRAFMQSPPMERSMSSALLHDKPVAQQLWQDYLSDLAHADARVYMTWLTMPGEPALHTALSDISVPTLCIAGREDLVVRLAEAKDAYMRVPGSELLVLDKCGHMLMVEQPEALHAALRDFFK